MRGGHSYLGQAAGTWRKVRHFFGAPRDGGFTIIEVMIVLGVSAALFVATSLVIAGRQNQTAFDQAIRQIQSQIQQTLNEVSVGYFPQETAFQCTAGGAVPALSGGSNTQGTNSGCVFLGKALQFKIAGTANPEQFVAYVIAGLKQGGAGGAESSSLAEAKPVIVAPGITHSSGGYPDLSVYDKLQNGLTTSRMWYNNGGSDVEIGAVAFITSLAQYSSGNIVSGAGQVNIVPVDGTSLSAASTTVVEAMNSDGGNALASSPVNPVNGVYICFSSASTDQYGLVKIGGNTRDLSVTLTIKGKNNTTCS